MTTREINTGVVTAISDTDLVTVCDAGGALRPISFANLMKAVRGGIQVGGTNLALNSDSPISSATTKYYQLSTDLSELPGGTPVVCSFDYEFSGITLGENPRFGLQSGIKQMSGYQQYIECLYRVTSTSGKGRVSQVTYIPEGADVSMTRILGFIQRVSGGSVKLSNVKVEVGNIPTAWSPAPEDLRGGVIGYQPITCNSAGKGGAHECDEHACGHPEDNADCVLGFGSIDTACQFLGRTCEDGDDAGECNREDESGLERLSRSLGHLHHRQLHEYMSECSCAGVRSGDHQFRRFSDNPSGRSRRTDLLPFVYIGSLAALEGSDSKYSHSVVAGKEVAA